MTAVDTTAALRALHEARAVAELAAADASAPGSDVVAWRGNLVPSVAVVKGLPGPAEAAGGPALSGRDGEAVCKALQKLGHDPALVFFTLTRPQANMAPEARARRVRLQLEAVDAPLVIALDRPAAEDIAEAFSMPQLPSGAEVRACGRRFVACDGLESALDDDRAKRAVWRQLSAAVLQPPAF